MAARITEMQTHHGRIAAIWLGQVPRALGKRISTEGWPAPGETAAPPAPPKAGWQKKSAPKP